MKYPNVHAAMRTSGLEAHVVVSGEMVASEKADVAIVASSRMYNFKSRHQSDATLTKLLAGDFATGRSQERSTFSVLVAASAYGRAKIAQCLIPF